MRDTYAEAVIQAGGLPTWVLELSSPDGRRFLFSTAAIAITSRSTLEATPRQAIPMLSGIEEFVEELDLFTLDGVGALTQVRLALAWHESLAALQSDWMHFSASTAELSLLWDGQDWEDRFVLLASGTLQGIQFGVAGEATSIVVEATPPRLSATVGDDTQDLGTDFAGGLDDQGDPMSDLTGRKYQRIYGASLSVPGYKVGAFALKNRLVLAGHPFVDLTAVEVFEDGESVGTLVPINHDNGYCYVEHATRFRSTSGAYTYSPTSGGIAASDGMDRPALGADGVLRKLLSESDLVVDWERMEPTFQLLREWRIGFYLDKEATAISVIRDKIVGTVPIVEMNSGRGIWFAFSAPWSAPIEAELILGQGLLGRVGQMGISDLEAIENEITISHTFEAFSTAYTGTETRGPDDSTLCYLSQQLYGVRAAEPVESKSIHDATTAQRWANHRINSNGLPRRQVAYLASRDLYWLRAGMVVAVTDSELGIDRHRAVLRAVSRAQDPFQLSLDLIDRTPVSRLQ